MEPNPMDWQSKDKAVLERELNLRQHQINQLLKITQAINNNVSAKGLFDMYRSFLQWEMGVERMALYVRQEGTWRCSASIGVLREDTCVDIKDRLPDFTRMVYLNEETHPLLSQFDLVIPVLHKEDPIAYVFVGGFAEEEDMLSKLQFITTLTNVVAVAIENKRLFKRQLEQERLKREMELAGEMQRMLIPATLPTKKNYELASIYQPHYGVGGDYFDFLEFEDDKIVFCVGDISGKGVAAALLMANFQANFHTLIKKRTGLDEFIRDLNDSVNRITKGDRFITFFIAEYNIGKQELRYVNAGHNPSLLVTEEELRLLDKGCTLLGGFPQLPEVEVGKVRIDEDALILSYTDGLTDVQNPQGEFLKEEMLHRFVSAHHHLSASAFNARLMQEIEQFKGEQTYMDDFTVLTCKMFCQHQKPVLQPAGNFSSKG
jgi:sigma-B regulation protein RsbU (phosphoserine phosphatase)